MSKGKGVMAAAQTNGRSGKVYEKRTHGQDESKESEKAGESSAMGAGGRGKGKKRQVTTVADHDEGDDDSMPDDELMESLRRHDTSFTALLSLIPAHLYLAAEESDSETGSLIDADHDEQKAQGQKRKQDVAAEANERRKALKKEAKRAKLDPENMKNAIEVQQERERVKKEKRQQDDLETNGMDLSFTFDEEAMHAGDTDGEEEDDDDDADDDDDDDDGESFETLPTSTKGSEELSSEGKSVISSPLPGAPTTPGIFDLRARLQAKIQGLQAQRRATQTGGGGHTALSGNGAGGDDESTASTKDELFEERRKMRGEMRDKRRKAAKERKRLEREQQGSGASGKKASSNGNDNKFGGTKPPSLIVSSLQGQSNEAKKEKGQRDRTEGDYAFSAMQFDEDERLIKKNKHALPSDPKAALAILDARKRKEDARQAKREARLEAGGELDGNASAQAALSDDRQEHLKWSKAEAAASGVKIRDDEALLRKALKRREKQKAKSTKEWKKRGKDLASQQAARQKKRTDNIAARKDRKMKGGSGKAGSSTSAKSKALGKHKGSGGASSSTAGGRSGNKKARPGFEGKRRPLGKSHSSGGGSGSGGRGKKGGK